MNKNNKFVFKDLTIKGDTLSNCNKLIYNLKYKIIPRKKEKKLPSN